jgi:hypothetical protein
MMYRLEGRSSTLVDDANEIDDGAASLDRLNNVRSFDVSLYFFRFARSVVAKNARAVYERTHVVPVAHKPSEEMRTHEAAGAGEEDFHSISTEGLIQAPTILTAEMKTKTGDLRSPEFPAAAKLAANFLFYVAILRNSLQIRPNLWERAGIPGNLLLKLLLMMELVLPFRDRHDTSQRISRES